MSLIPGTASEIKVTNVTEINSPALRNYLAQRSIPLEIASRYCKQVEYSLNGKNFTAIGFQNDAGGYELRNPYFKGSASPKDIRFIDNRAKDVAVVEGFFDFLSLLVFNQKNGQAMTNFLVLNSLSFFEKNRSIMEKYEAIRLYLDRDSTGIKCTQKALEWNHKYLDKSDLYKNFKDLNECLVQQQHELKQSPRLRMRF